MTDRPPPPPGTAPPPPPPGGYPPPPPSQGYDPSSQAPIPGLPQGEYTPWLTRALAWIIDYIPVFILFGIGGVLLATVQKVETVCITDESEFDLGEFCATGDNGPSTTAWILSVVCVLAAIAYIAWNYGMRQGSTGSTIGKSIMKFKVVDETSGQPLGFGKSLVRGLLQFVAYLFCGLVWLISAVFPLFDAKRQSLFDKLFKSVCVPS